jgi:tetratricopeptide (TPR) repeat protein
MKGYEARRAARLAASSDTTSQADYVAIEPDYYDAALVKAFAHVELGQWEDALEIFDLYIAQYPTSADILVDRGNAKAELNDKVGAEKDFREALRFVPYDKEAKAGLERIGAAQ